MVILFINYLSNRCPDEKHEKLMINIHYEANALIMVKNFKKYILEMNYTLHVSLFLKKANKLVNFDRI